MCSTRARSSSRVRRSLRSSSKPRGTTGSRTNWPSPSAMSSTVEKQNLVAEFEQEFHRRGIKDQDKLDALWRLQQVGLPGPKTEEYKFTPVARYLEKSFVQREAATRPATSQPQPFLNDQKCNVVSFRNGRYSPEQSQIHDADLKVSIGKASNPGENADPFDLLNMAFHEEFVELFVATGKTLQYPVVIQYSFDGDEFIFANPRWNCHIGKGSGVTLIEYTVGQSSAYFNNKQSKISVAENAGLEYVIIQDEQADMFVGNSVVSLASSARASCFTYTFGGNLVRNNLSVIVDGEGIDAHLYGLYLLSNKTL